MLIDDAIFKLLWQWAIRRHPKKPRRWIKEKYFKTIGNRNWVFSGHTSDGKELRLTKAADTTIKRHIRIRTDANPYDPDDERYFDQRLAQKWLKSEKGSNKLRRIWQRQDGICPVCKQKIIDTDSWDLHHLVHRVWGGSDNLQDLVLLHPNCHKQVHHLDLTIALPSS